MGGPTRRTVDDDIASLPYSGNGLTKVLGYMVRHAGLGISPVDVDNRSASIPGIDSGLYLFLR
jgi:hypothetical protein